MSLWHGMLRASSWARWVVWGRGKESMENSPFFQLFAHLSPGQQPERFANSVDPFNSINCRVSICKTFRLVTNPGAFVVTMSLGDFPVSFSCPIPQPYHSTPK